MRKIVVSTWMSLDGVFDGDTMGQWFTPFDSIPRQEYIRDGILECDALLLGRKTYEMLAPYWSAQKNNEMGVAAKLNSVSKFVVSSALKKADWNNTTIINKNVIDEIKKLKGQPGNIIQVEGSATLVLSLMEANLIDEYRFLVHPVVAGSGKHFFKDGMQTPGMNLIKTEKLDKGVLALYYQTA